MLSDIIEALKPKQGTFGRTRSLVGPGQQAAPALKPEQQRLIDSLKTRTRAITIEERAQVVEIVKEKPSIDFEINFDYDSAAINAKALPILMALGKALSNPELKGATFVIGGHTDAAGSDGYNLDLSRRRAEAVKRFLVEKFQLPHETLLAIGFGEEHLKNKLDGLAPENRRVQVANVAPK